MLLAVPINSATVMFTMNAFDPLITSMAENFQIENYFSTLKVAVFLLLQFVVFLIVTFVSISIPDESFEFRVNKERTAQVISNLAIIDQFERAESKIDKLTKSNQEKDANIIQMGKEIKNLKAKINSLSSENEELKAHHDE